MRLLDLLLGRSRGRSGRADTRSQRPSVQLGLEALEERTVLDASANLAFVTKAYQVLLHRDPEPAALTLWGHALNIGAARTVIALNILHSPEFRGIEIQDLSQLLLKHPADTSLVNQLS